MASVNQNNRCLRLISWNVKGLNNLTKLNKVLTHLQQLKGDVILLQEIHLRTTEISHLRRGWAGHLFHSRFSERARGAAILIRKDIAFEPSNTISDPNGCYVAVSGRLQNIPVILACISAPTWDDDKFIIRFFSDLSHIDDHHIIIGGDFNLVQDTKLDRSSPKPTVICQPAGVIRPMAIYTLHK